MKRWSHVEVGILRKFTNDYFYFRFMALVNRNIPDSPRDEKEDLRPVARISTPLLRISSDTATLTIRRRRTENEPIRNTSQRFRG
jgi:hypothetical protein